MTCKKNKRRNTMKRLSKILLLVLALALSCTLLSVLAFAADAAPAAETGAIVPPAEHSNALFSVTVGATTTYYTDAADFTFDNIKGGTTVLYGDIAVPATITFTSKTTVSINLNGKALSYAGTMFSINAKDYGHVLFVYNDNTAEAGKLYANAFYNAQHRNHAYIGYASTSVKGAGRITAVVGQTGSAGAVSNTQKYYNVDFVNTSYTGMDWFGYHNGNSILSENCNFYFEVQTWMVRTNRNPAANVKFVNCNLYFKQGGGFFYRDDNYGSYATTARGTFTFENSNVYGDQSFYGRDNHNDFSFGAGCRFFELTPEGVELIVPDGMQVFGDHYTENVSFTYQPTMGGDATTFAETFTTNFIVGEAGAYDFYIENGDEDIYCKAGAFVPAVVDGKTVVLNNDITVSALITGATIDLNGHALTATATFLGNGSTLKSSAPGAVVYGCLGNDHEDPTDSIANGNVNIGTADSERITLYVNKINYHTDNTSRTTTITNCDLFNMAAHNDSRGMSWFGRPSWSRVIKVDFINCNIYAVETLKILTVWQPSHANNQVNFTDSNIYGNVTVFGNPSKINGSITEVGTMNLKNTKMYGNVVLNGDDDLHFAVTADANCSFSVNDAQGTSLAPSYGTAKVPYTVGGVAGGATAEFDTTTLATFTPVEDASGYAFYVANGDSKLYYNLSDFTPATVNGKKIVLNADITTDQTFTSVNIDLNGHSLTTSANPFMTSSTTNYIYNNAQTSAHLYANGYLLNADAADNLYIGYSDASTQATGRVTLVANSSLTNGKSTRSVYLYNVDLVNKVASDWAKSGTALFMSYLRTLTVNVDNCNFYAENTMALIGGPNAGSFVITVKNSNFYGTAAVVGRLDNAKAPEVKPAIDLDNVHFFGQARVFGRMERQGGGFALCYYADFDENCTFDLLHEDYVTPDGKKVVPSLLSENVSFTYGEDGVFKGGFYSRYKYGTDADIKAITKTFYRNINIDVDINFNLYVPAEYTHALENLKGAVVTGTTVIGGKTYTVLTVKQAPKDAYVGTPVTLFGGTVTYSADVVSYASALLKLADTTDYNKDSKAMAKYVLYYIRTTAVAADATADVSKIDTLLGGFVLTEDDKAITETLGNVSGLGAALKSAALDLNSRVGIVLEVKPGFVGTITVTMAGMEPITKTYEEAAGADEYIIIGDIPVYDFRNMITVSVDGTVVGTYNLATYVSRQPGDVAYAVYAYSKAAYAYQVKYGNPTTTD